MLILYFVYPILIFTKYVIIFNTIRTIFPLFIVKRHIYIQQLKLIFFTFRYDWPVCLIKTTQNITKYKTLSFRILSELSWTIRPYESAKEHYEYIDC